MRAQDKRLAEAIVGRDMASALRAIADGANSNARTVGDQWCAPMLTLAAIHGDRDTVSLLLQHGADVNARDANGLTPLIQVAVNARNATAYDTCVALLEHGADVNARTRTGKSALDYAAEGAQNARWLQRRRPPVGVDYDVRVPARLVRLFLDHGAVATHKRTQELVRLALKDQGRERP